MDIGRFIVKTPGTCGGRARLAGKRIPVSSIYRWSLQGAAPEDVLDKFDGVGLSEIYAAICYALANLPEITREIESADQLVFQATTSTAGQPVESKWAASTFNWMKIARAMRLRRRSGSVAFLTPNPLWITGLRANPQHLFRQRFTC